MESVMQATRNGVRAALFVAAFIVSAASTVTLKPSLAFAVDTVMSKDAPDLTSVRAKIKAKDYQAAVAELKTLADTHQQADVYSRIGFSLRKTGDYPTALTYYKKALDFDANHRGAREYLGELYVETGDLPKAREQMAVLSRLRPAGCEETEQSEKGVESISQIDFDAPVQGVSASGQKLTWRRGVVDVRSSLEPDIVGMCCF